MSETPTPSGPQREVIAPRHESLVKHFDRPAGPSPLGYGEVRLWLVARDAHSVFAYWEFRPEEHPEANRSDGTAEFFIRVLRDDGQVETCIQIEPSASDWTINVGAADSTYEAELGFYSPQGVWCFLARSGRTRTPPENGQPPRSIEELRKLAQRRSQQGEGAWTPELEEKLSSLLKRDTTCGTDPSTAKPIDPEAKRRPRPRPRNT
jgi:hypothetical protein